MSIFKHGDKEAIINSVAMFKYWRYFFPFSDQGDITSLDGRINYIRNYTSRMMNSSFPH